ncbi:MAG: hypothetical protein IJK32_03135 [Bacteroidales bacterium]|nr:hypothetical protein [Bacteroidales bacterium]
MRRITGIFFSLTLLLGASACSEKPSGTTTVSDLAGMFAQPPIEYGPYVWWHWMGPNFSKEGIRKDLEAMRESGIAGATIFNLTSAVQESEGPVGNNPWPDQTYRSPKYWEALYYAAEVAEELGLKVGLHNSPGYSTTGGPWIDEDKGMQTVVSSSTPVTGGRKVKVTLPVPNLPSFSFYSDFAAKATKFHDIAVMAVPAKKDARKDDVIDLTGNMDASGTLTWVAPAGKWTVFRIGHACTMAFPHPVPEELIGKCFEVDKMSAELTAFHWDNVLDPLEKHVGKYFGKSFTHMLIDSYEAGDQNWTEGFREEFTQEHGYDPVPLFALKGVTPGAEDVKKFDEDMKATISRLFIDNGFKVARDKIHAKGLKLFWEPYTGPFSTAESVAIADLPMGEFWTHGNGRISGTIVDKAKEAGINIVGAEAFTGWPTNSHYTEDPAFLKKSADGTFLSGTNLLFLHHWVHQPFDDRYQPGMGMGWWGTHFGRNQTWFEPGKEFFRYLTRCQMMLRQGVLEDRAENWIHRKTTDSDIFFTANQEDSAVVVSIPVPERSRKDGAQTVPEAWDPYTGKISLAGGLEGTAPDSLYVTLEPGKSMFVVLNYGKSSYKKAPVYVAKSTSTKPVGGTWDVEFVPKMDEAFSVKSFNLKDFSQCDDQRIQFFAGTATYTATIQVDKEDLAKDKRIVLDLGELNDLVEVSVNGEKTGVLWYPPYKTDITDYLKGGENVLSLAVTNNWANRMIGDERFEPDFEWGYDRGETFGKGIKDFPEWFMKDTPRPSEDRKTFFVWTYFRPDSKLEPAGLVGPVNLEIQSL